VIAECCQAGNEWKMLLTHCDTKISHGLHGFNGLKIRVIRVIRLLRLRAIALALRVRLRAIAFVLRGLTQP
jgi:hypothetical protein